MHQFPNQEARDDFAEWLRAEIEEDTVPHARNVQDLPLVMPGKEESEPAAYVHPAMFSFSRDCSQCGPVELHKAKSLLEQFVVDGFVSSSEPVMLKKPVPLSAYCTQSLSSKNPEKTARPEQTAPKQHLRCTQPMTASVNPETKT